MRRAAALRSRRASATFLTRFLTRFLLLYECVCAHTQTCGCLALIFKPQSDEQKHK